MHMKWNAHVACTFKTEGLRTVKGRHVQLYTVKMVISPKRCKIETLVAYFRPQIGSVMYDVSNRGNCDDLE